MIGDQLKGHPGQNLRLHKADEQSSLDSILHELFSALVGLDWRDVRMRMTICKFCQIFSFNV
jgi:hypothetical protein